MRCTYLYKLLISLLLGLLALTTSTAQNIDSLKQVLAKTTEPKAKIKVLIKIIEGAEEYDEWIPYNNQLLHLSKQLIANKDATTKKIGLKSLSEAVNNLAVIAYDRDKKYFLAAKLFKQSTRLNILLKDTEAITSSYLNLNQLFFQIGLEEKSSYYLQELEKITIHTTNAWLKQGFLIRKLSERLGSENIDSSKLENYITQLIDLLPHLQDKNNTLYTIARYYEKNKKYYLAEKYWLEALKLSHSDKLVIFTALIETNLHLNSKKKVLSYCDSINSYSPMLAAYFKMIVYASQHDYANAIKAIQPYLNKLKELVPIVAGDNVYKQIKIVYAGLGNYKKAYEMAELSATFERENKAEELRKVDAQKIIQYEYQEQAAADKLKHDTEQKIKDAQLSVQQQKIQQQKLSSYLLLVGLLALGAIALFAYYRFNVTRKQKHIIEEQKVLVEEKNKEILDSIHYAKRLQKAILPTPTALQSAFKDHFVYYKPKDIVAGDFYWIAEVQNKVLIAVADSTGHGVPGAMVSVVCSNSLNRAVKEFGLIDPGKILDKTRELVIETFQAKDEQVKDGMDVSLLVIDKAANTLAWAGANNGLWYRPLSYLPEGEKTQTETAISSPLGRLGGASILEIKPNKQPIGYIDNAAPFTTHFLTLNEVDNIYLFTDGYADQFGGEKNKKFKYAPLKSLIENNAHLPMQEQYTVLDKQFTNWKGANEQVDDVTIIGIRISS